MQVFFPTYNNRANQPIPIPPTPRTPAHFIFALLLSIPSMPCLDVLIRASPISLCPELVETAYFAFCTYFRNLYIYLVHTLRAFMHRLDIL